MVKALLDFIAQDYNTSVKDLQAIMNASQILFIYQGSRKVCLSAEIEQHPLWQNNEMWKYCVSKIINYKFHEAIRQIEIAEKKEESKEPMTVAGNWLFGKLKEVIKSNDKKEKKPPTISKTVAQNIVFNNMSLFIGYFVNLKLAFEPSRELVMFVCKKFELD